jgi:hypothetical protein
MTRVLPVVLLVGSCGFFMATAAQEYPSPDHSNRREGFGIEHNSVSPTTPSRNESVAPGQATISAAEIRIPRKARDAYRKAWLALGENKLGDAARYVERPCPSVLNTPQRLPYEPRWRCGIRTRANERGTMPRKR